MRKLIILISGELKRLVKYHVVTASLFVTILWAIFIYFIDDVNLFSEFLPIILMIDATMMSIIFIGAMMHFEKTESTISTMLVAPVTNKQLILSKAIANTIHTFISCILLILVVYFIKGIAVNLFFVTTGLIISIFFHSLLGFIFSFHSKSFTGMLMNVMIYNFLITVPTILHAFGVFLNGEIWEYILLILPAQSAINLMVIGFDADTSMKALISLMILLSGIILGFKYYILPKFKEYAVKQSGV